MRRGPLLMMLGSLSFTTMVGLVKVVREELSAFEVIFWRGAVALVLLSVLARPPRFRITNVRVFSVRLALGFTAMACFYGAAKGLPLADLTLISRLQPILVALGAPLVLGVAERSEPALWAVLGVGLAGTAILLAPELAVGSVFGVLAFFGALSSAGAHLALRGLGATESTRAVVFAFQAGLLLLSFLVLLASGAPPALPERSLWLPLLGVGATATAGQLLVTQAYSVDRAAVVAAAGYSSVLWAFSGDVLFFGLTPSANALVGGAFVVGAGIWLLRRRGPGAPPPEP